MPDIQPHNARLMFDPSELHYDFGEGHPFQARRIGALIDLLQASDLWNGDPRVSLPVRPATVEELGLIHTPEYIAAVQQLSQPDAAQTDARKRDELLMRYGFADGDTPAVAGMHDITALLCGGTLVAMSAVMGLPEGGHFATEEERPLHVFHPAGGLHHAWAERASGFCVYNDIAVAIAHVLQATGAKVLYVDFDAHHGDGVQRAFYDDPRVMTISMHETGRYLFPGTGDVLEMGKGLGRGYSVNIPLEPFTEDDSFIEVMEALLPPLVTSFAPDIILTQHGCDGHAWDPLTHLSLTTRSFKAQAKLAHELAHTYSHGRWVAVGGGGYDLFRVVPRAWSIVWSELSEQPLPEFLPDEWVTHWRAEWMKVQEEEAETQEAMGKTPGDGAFPTRFLDKVVDFPAQPRRWSISRTNRHTIALARHLLLTSSMRQAFPTAQNRSPLASIVDLLHIRGNETPSRIQHLETNLGPLILRDFCPPSLIERLQPDGGLRAFARIPEREHQLLLGIARRSDCALTVAHTHAGQIVGEVTLAPGDAWWEGLDNVYEVAIEVSSHWRGQGLATKLLAFALELDALEDMILFAEGLSWHWDVEGLGLSVYRYRELIAHLFSTMGFTEQPTTEPNISLEPANILMVRVGNRVDQRTSTQFFNRMMSMPNMARL